MNKVICNVCGTSYPENASQCPICGSTQNEKIGIGDHDNTESTYTYVKGGRYSKANVKKRNAANQTGMSTIPTSPATNTQQKKNKRGMVIIAVVLLITIILVSGFIALRFLVPNNFIYVGMENFFIPSIEQNETIPTESVAPESITTIPSTEADNSCRAVILSDTQVTLTSYAQTHKLEITLEPADTVDDLQIVSSDPNVAYVDNNGVITANADGTSIITVTCGEISAECTVICTFETTATEPVESSLDDTLRLNRKEITFDMEGQSWVLYSGGNISVFDITWYSDNDAVATMVNGKVVAVAEGDTTVYGSYGDQVVSCIIHCDFDSLGNESSSGGVSEANGDAIRIYKLHNPYGLSDDVTIHIGEQFPLMLVDEQENKITNAQWSVGDTDCCSYENETVKGLTIGTTEITATYEGTTYTCVVRVIE